MGFVAFLVIVVVVCVVAAVAVWILGQIGTPAIIPKAIWIVAVLIILFVLLKAMGILGGADIPIPRVR